MSLLANITSDKSIADEKDSVGGNGPLDSNAYLATIKLAYLTKAASEAVGLTIHAQVEGNREVRETLWITSGKAKGAKNYYEKDGEKHYLPGYLIAQSLALLATSQELSALETENKVVKLYSFDAKAEVPTKVDVVMDLIGKEVILGVIKETVDKTKKNDAGVYAPTGDSRDVNVIDKVFRAADRKTTAEIRAEAEEAVFYSTWVAKWKDKVRDKTSKLGVTAGAPGGSKAPGFGVAANQPTKKPATSLFS